MMLRVTTYVNNEDTRWTSRRNGSQPSRNCETTAEQARRKKQIKKASTKNSFIHSSYLFLTRGKEQSGWFKKKFLTFLLSNSTSKIVASRMSEQQASSIQFHFSWRMASLSHKQEVLPFQCNNCLFLVTPVNILELEEWKGSLTPPDAKLCMTPLL